MRTVVRIGMSIDEGARLAPLLIGLETPYIAAVKDQIWLRTLMVEQRRKMPHAERDAFNARADRILKRLDPE